MGPLLRVGLEVLGQAGAGGASQVHLGIWAAVSSTAESPVAPLAPTAGNGFYDSINPVGPLGSNVRFPRVRARAVLCRAPLCPLAVGARPHCRFFRSEAERLGLSRQIEIRHVEPSAWLPCLSTRPFGKEIDDRWPAWTLETNILGARHPGRFRVPFERSMPKFG